MIRSRVVDVPPGSGAPVQAILSFKRQRDLGMRGIGDIRSLNRPPSFLPKPLALSQSQLIRFKANQAY